jgi:hypothetical protein
MASSSSALIRFQSACVICARGGQRFVGRYRDFLASPGTLFTLASLLLLIAATMQTPDGLVNSAHAHTWLYLAAALAGSVYIWWSAIQGIRERDFTADIPVSFATAAALIIGQYSAAVLLLLGGMLEEFVSARRQCPGLVGKAAPGPGGRQAWRRGPGGSPGGGAKR